MEDKNYVEAIASLMKDKSQRRAFAELMVEWIQPNHITTDFVGMLLNTRQMKEGDALVKKLRKGIRVRTLVPGSIHLADEVTISERTNYLLDGLDVKLTYNLWEMESGDLGTVGELRNEMLAKLRDTFQGKVFSALSTIWSVGNTPTNFTDVGGAITDTALKNAIDNINQNVGRVRAVVGARSALTPITLFGGFWRDTVNSNVASVDSNIEEIMQTGWLGRYYGAPIVAIDQIWDNPEDYNTLIPTDKILVIGENVGEFITYGEPRWKEWEDMNPTPPQWFLEVYQRFGMIIDKAQGIHVLKVS